MVQDQSKARGRRLVLYTCTCRRAGGEEACTGCTLPGYTLMHQPGSACTPGTRTSGARGTPPAKGGVPAASGLWPSTAGTRRMSGPRLDLVSDSVYTQSRQSTKGNPVIGPRVYKDETSRRRVEPVVYVPDQLILGPVEGQRPEAGPAMTMFGPRTSLRPSAFDWS